jgi:hypothetical protein
MTENRISKKQIFALSERLSEKDREILLSVQRCRYLTSKHIQRLHFTNLSTQTVAIRAANLILRKLREYGLIGTLARRIGGVRAGSNSYVWRLEPAGHTLLHITSNDTARKHRFEPSVRFLSHTLHVSDIYVSMVELCRRRDISLVRMETEPDCWRRHMSASGRPATLMPDLYAVTRAGGYQDSWFIEIDLDTEAMPQIRNKCDRYIRYYQTGVEQKQNKVFPYIVWIAPDGKRKANIRGQFPEKHVDKLFLVIEPHELEPLIAGGVEEYLKNTNPKGESL